MYGAGAQEVAEILNKMYFQFKLGGKTMIQAPVKNFPAIGGANGAITAITTVSPFTFSFAKTNANVAAASTSGTATGLTFRRVHSRVEIAVEAEGPGATRFSRLAAEGGRGGRGNAKFLSQRRRAPYRQCGHELAEIGHRGRLDHLQPTRQQPLVDEPDPVPTPLDGGGNGIC